MLYSCGQTHCPLLRAAQTDLSDDRMRRLMARLDAHGFIVRHEMREMLYAHELAHSMVQPSSSIYAKVRGCGTRVGVCCVCMC